jgi:hypothetical protein
MVQRILLKLSIGKCNDILSRLKMVHTLTDLSGEANSHVFTSFPNKVISVKKYAHFINDFFLILEPCHGLGS